MRFLKKHLYKGVMPALVATGLMLGAVNAQAVNHFVLPETASHAVKKHLKEVGRFSTVPTTYNQGEPLTAPQPGDIQKLGNLLYLSTVNLPCIGATGDDTLAAYRGALILDVKNPRKPIPVAQFIPENANFSSIANMQIKKMRSGNLMVIKLDGGCGVPSGQEGPNEVRIYSLDNPIAPTLLSKVIINDPSIAHQNDYGLVDVNAADIQLFRKGKKDYLALTSWGAFEGGGDGVLFGSLQFFDISDPTDPKLVSTWGPENIPNDQIFAGDNRYRDILLSHVPLAERNQLPAIPLADIAARPINDDDYHFLTPISRFVFSDLYPSFVTPELTTATIRQATYVRISDNAKRAYVSMYEAGHATLDIRNIHKPKLISIARNVSSSDAVRSRGEGSQIAVATKNGKIVVDRNSGAIPFNSELFITTTNDGEPLDPPAKREFNESGFSVPILDLPVQPVTGATRYVGLGCTFNANGNSGIDNSAVCGGDAFCLTPPPLREGASIALVSRGACAFVTKATNALAAGYDHVLIIDAPGQAGLVGLGGDPLEPLAAAVGSIRYETGLELLSSIDGTITDLTIAEIGKRGEAVLIQSDVGKGGALRIWDYANPKQPVLASTIDTVCTDNPIDASCGQDSQSIADIVISGKKAYVSWTNTGVVVLDISNPYHPVEIGRFEREGDTFEQNNGIIPFGNAGAQSVIQTLIDKRSGCLFVLDSNGGLYVLDQKGNKKCKERKGHHRNHH